MKSTLEPSNPFTKTGGAISGVSRFLSKREKGHKSHFYGKDIAGSKESHDVLLNPKGAVVTQAFDPASSTDFYGLFYDKTKASKEEDADIKAIKQKILSSKGVMLRDGQILWALRSKSVAGDIIAAYGLLVAMSNASEGIVTPFNPNAKLLGAVNRNAVTCFLDSTLFSMFSRLDSFEAMLYNSFEDVAKERLAFLLRLWVNLLRTGLLISTDITKQVQESLAECGWLEARELQQQDASEAFTFLTEQLNLPLLTLKMDIYHTGKQDNDDHKFIKERLLEVAIPTLENGEHPKEVKLEDCLEEYFNNRIEVKRYLERRNTLQSVRTNDSKAKEMGLSVHVETVELDPDIATPLTPLSPMPSYITDRPVYRNRASSIIQERYIPNKSETPMSSHDDPRTPIGRLRTGSVRKEVLMPAWQFFSLIPWYTDNAPSDDAQVAAHFSSKRPVLGLCLKRYSYTNSGHAIRLDTFIDIPVEIGLPHFIQDDSMSEDGPLYGNFKLSLQSVVCHRGYSVDSGHYIALVKYTVPAKGSDQEDVTNWLRFDDLASPRVSLIDIHKALREETPYLLFYQILPVDGDPGNLTSGESNSISHAASDASRPPTSGGDPLVAATNGEDQGQPSTSKEQQRSSDGPQERSPDLQAKRRPSAISFSDYLPGRGSLDATRPQGSLSPDHKKSPSFNQGLTKTISKLSMRGRDRSKEDLVIDDTDISGTGPQIHIEQVATTEATQEPVVNTIRNHSAPGLMHQSPPSTTPIANTNTSGLGRSRSKREKSRSRLHKSGKGKSEDDRECIVM